MKTTKFEITKSHNRMQCIEGDNLSTEQCVAVRNIISNNYSDSEDYKLKVPCAPFLQGYRESYTDDHHDGWVLIEFWSDNNVAQQMFVDHINTSLGFTAKDMHGEELIVGDDVVFYPMMRTNPSVLYGTISSIVRDIVGTKPICILNITRAGSKEGDNWVRFQSEVEKRKPHTHAVWDP